MSLLNIDTEDCGIGHALRCAHCGGDYLHHGAVAVYTRDHEDSATGISVEVDANGGVKVGQSMAGNPSHRRDGMVIALECESCLSEMHLTISQHKGQTFLDMELLKVGEQ